MGTCERCAPAEPGGTFCAVCGSFLGWEPAPAEQGPTPPTRPAQPEQPEETVAAVQPGRPVTRPPSVRPRADTDQAGPFEVVCGACGTPNPAARRFCRRCGALLAGAAGTTGRASWWRRAWRALRRALWRRPGRGGLPLRIIRLALILALLACLGYGALLLGRRASDAIRDELVTPEPVRPVSVTASSQTAGHPADAVVDGLSNAYWAPDVTRSGHGEYVEFTFVKPFRLLDLIIHSGVSPRQDAFLGQARPAELELTTWNQAGEQVSVVLRLADEPGPQTFRRVVPDVVTVRLTIRSSYGGTAGQHQVAIGEIEFFGRP